MRIQVAYVVVSGRDAVLRATPKEVQNLVAHAKATVVFTSELEVHSGEEEYLRLWGQFIAEAEKYGKEEFAEKAHEIFYRKGMNLWTTFLDVPNVAIFPSWHHDVIVQVSKNSVQ